MFENSGWGGQGGNQINISTRFITSVSDTSMLTIGGWNNSLSIRITPSIGVDQNGNRMYDKNRAFQTALSQDNAKSLYLAYAKKIKPLVDAETPEAISVGVPVGRDTKRSIVSIEMVPTESGSFDMFLVCYTALDQDNVASEGNTFRHRFKKTVSIRDYQAQTGQGDLEEVNGDFENFVDKLEFIGNLLPISHHGAKYADASAAAYRGNSSQNNNGGGWNNSSMSAPANNTTMNGYQNDTLPFLS